MEKTNCKNCGELPVEKFYKHHKKGYQNLCIDCKSQYNKKHYIKDKEKYLNRATKRNKITKDILKQNITNFLLNKKCENCSETDIVTFDFHHRDPKGKKFEIAKGLVQGYLWETILEEINKCIILCANCHRKLHAKENNNYKYKASLV